MLVTKREARKMGRERGLAAASWAMDGNWSDEAYRTWLRRFEDGDPRIEEMTPTPSWLSGEWAGESISEILGEADSKRDLDRLGDVEDAYSEAADTAYWRELERVARYMAREG